MRDVTEARAEVPSAIVQRPVARWVAGSGSWCEPSAKRRVSPLARRISQQNQIRPVAATREGDESAGPIGQQPADQLPWFQIVESDVREAFPEMTGFSPRNLKYMRAFAVAWPDRQIVQAPLAQLTWYHRGPILVWVSLLQSSDGRMVAGGGIREKW